MKREFMVGDFAITSYDGDVLERYRGLTCRVVYDFSPDEEVWSTVDTLIPICDDLDTDKIDAFIDNM